MQNEFEKKVQQTLAGFDLTPSKEVWDGVAQQINKEKKRRKLLVLWWMAAIVLLLGGTAALYLANQKSTIVKEGQQFTIQSPERKYQNNELTTNRTKEKGENIEPFSNLQEGKIDKNEKIAANKSQKENAVDDVPEKLISNKTVAVNKTSEATKVTNRPTDKATITISGIEASVNKKLSEVERKKQQATVKFENNNSNTKTSDNSPGITEDNEVNKTGRENSLNTTYDITLQKSLKEQKTDSIELTNDVASNNGADLPVNFTTSNNDSLISKTATNKKKTAVNIANKSIRFGLVISMGVSNNQSGFPVLAKKAVADVQYLNSPPPQNGVPTLGGSSNINGYRLTFDPSFSASIGGFAEKSLGKKMKFSAGVTYQYFSATTTTGAKVTNTRALLDSTAFTRFTLNEYYTTSNTQGNNATVKNRFVNQYHFLQLPLNFRFNVNKQHSKPIVVSAGITPGLIVSTNALYYDRFNHITYINKKQFNSFQLSAQAGLLFDTKKSNKNGLQVGPQLQYGLTNLTKSIYNTRQHLFFIGLQANYYFKK